MSKLPVVSPAGASNPVKVAVATDETGAVNVQVVQLGLPDQGAQIIDLLAQILNELRALRMDTDQIGGIKYEVTNNLIDEL
jgi:hypothetical protein